MSKAAQVTGFVITTVIALAALVVSAISASSTKGLNDAQTQQIMQLEKTIPTGSITEMVPYGASPAHAAALTGVRRDPLVMQQIYNVYGTALNVPDDGNLFMDVHYYGKSISTFNQTAPQFYLVPVRLRFGKSVADQRWEAAGVYIGKKAAPSSTTSYRLSLYFCNSIDSKKIFTGINNVVTRNYGLPSLPYPSCKQLDSIFVRRGR